MSESKINLTDIKDQVKDYAEIKPDYENFARILEKQLENAVKKMNVSASVSSRAKGVPNFAEKIIRKPTKDPVNQLTDLCGARVIVNNMDEIEPVCEFIRKSYDIDEANSEDVVDRLGESKFGYRSVHFIVSLKPDEKESVLEKLCNSLDPQISLSDLDRLLEFRSNKETLKKGLSVGPVFKAEIQVRTLIQHAWAEFAHDQIYKSEFKVPETLKRDANRIAATLEAADASFARTSRDVNSYYTYFGAYMDQDAMELELEKLQTIYKFDANNTRLAGQIARLAIIMGKWQVACSILAKDVVEWKESPNSQALMECSKEFKKAEFEKQQDKRAAELVELDKKLYRLKDPVMAALLHDYAWAEWKADPKQDFPEDLLLASLLDRENTDIFISMADVYKYKADNETNRKKRDNMIRSALAYYEGAYKMKPSGPRSLAGLVTCKVEVDRDLKILDVMYPVFDKFIDICKKRAKVNVFLPDAFFYSGLFHLFSRRPYDALNDYAKAVELCTSTEKIQKACNMLSDIEHLAKADDDIRFEWAISFLTAAIYAKQCQLKKMLHQSIKLLEEQISGNNDDSVKQEKIQKEKKKLEASKAELEQLEKGISKSIEDLNELCINETKHEKEKIIIVSGGCDKKVKNKILEYEKSFETAFETFSGIIFSGGTTDGISGLVGRLPTPEGQIKRVAYLPESTPSWIELDKAGYFFRKTQGSGFSPLESIQMWIELFATEITPDEIKLIGVNGGRISAFEYRMALAFNAQVGIIMDSGRAAHQILQDKDWKNSKNLMALPHDPLTIKYFVMGYDPVSYIDEASKEKLAKQAHEKYLQDAHDNSPKDPALLPWEKLSGTLKNSNLDQINFINEKLSAVGLTVKEAEDKNKLELYKFSEEQIDIMAEMEHARWNMERLKDGWKLGDEKNVEKKITPHLVPWTVLSDAIKQYDVDSVVNIPSLLEKVGYQIVEK